MWPLIACCYSTSHQYPQDWPNKPVLWGMIIMLSCNHNQDPKFILNNKNIHDFFMWGPSWHNVSQLTAGVSSCCCSHYNDVIMGTMASEITSLTIDYSTAYSGADPRKHQSSASLAFVRGIHRGPVNSPHKWPVTRKMFPFDDVIMISHWTYVSDSNMHIQCHAVVICSFSSQNPHNKLAFEGRVWISLVNLTHLP